MLPYSPQCIYLNKGTREWHTTYLLAWASALHRSNDMGNARRPEEWDDATGYSLPCFFVCANSKPINLYHGEMGRISVIKKHETDYNIECFY